MVVIYIHFGYIYFMFLAHFRDLYVSLSFIVFFSFCAAGGVKFDTCLVKTFFFFALASVFEV